MDKIKATLLILILACTGCLFLTGCMVIWSDHVFIATLFKVVDANNLEMISEPNYLQIVSGDSETRNDNIKLKALVGGVPVGLESEGK